MPIVKLSQYPKHSVPLDIKGQLLALQNEVGQTDRHFADRLHGLICTLSVANKVIAFSESSLDQDTPKIENISVAPFHQNSGIGTLLLTHTLRKIASLDKDQVRVDCEKTQARFFERLGFCALNEAFHPSHPVELFHPCVSLTLKHLPKSTHLKGEPDSAFMTLGEASETYHYHDEAGFMGLHQLMLNQARKRVWILCYNIQNPVLNREHTSEALHRFIKRNPQTEIRFLLTNDKSGAGYYNPCINLAQKLSSYIEVRGLQHTGRRINEMITLVDYEASIFRKNPTDFSGFTCFYNRLLFERMRSNFDSHWQFAKPSLQLRRLAI